MAVVIDCPPRPLTTDWLKEHADFSYAGVDDVREATEQDLDEDGGTPGVNSAIQVLQVRGAKRGDDGQAVACRCVVKRSSPGPALDVAILQHWYLRERGFYKEVASELASGGVSLRVPRCAALGPEVQGPAQEDFVLVLELFTAPEWQTADPPLGCSAAQAVAAVSALAEMHGYFVAQPDALRSHEFLPTTPVHVEFGDRVQLYYVGAWEKVRAEMPEGTLPNAVVNLCDEMCNSYSLLLRRLALPPLSLVHGDFRLENLRFAAEGNTVAAFDWQFCCACRGAYDLAYFLCLALTPRARREHEEGLRRCYADAFRRAGGERAETVLRDLEDDLCCALLLVLASFIIGAATAPESAQEMHHRSMTWLGAAAMDWNAGRVLPRSSDRPFGGSRPIAVGSAR